METAQRHIFYGMKYLDGSEWREGKAVITEADRIKSIIPLEMLSHHLPAELHEYPNTYHLIPGLIDMHVHGAAGADVMDGTASAFNVISASLAAEGVTGYLATTMTAPPEKLVTVLENAASCYQQVKPAGAALLGVHLEGPFISKEKLGAQYGEYACLPDEKLFDRWQAAANGLIRLVTLAPELPNALSFIEKLKRAGVIASIGHTNATYDETLKAMTAGCTRATHFFNAMRGLHQREPGATGAILLAENISVELIADGLHLHPAILSLIKRLKGWEQIVLVTDAMRAKCCGDGQYELGGQQITVFNGKAVTNQGTLAGSTLRLFEAVNNMAAMTGCSLAESILMATANPARQLGLGASKGKIAMGYDADLVVLDERFSVIETIRAGVPVFKQLQPVCGVQS